MPCGTNLEESKGGCVVEIYDENDLYMGEIDKDFIELFDELLQIQIANLGKGQCMQWDNKNGWQEIHLNINDNYFMLA